MKGPTVTKTTTMHNPPLHTRVPMRRNWFNRLFALLYLCAISALLYHHYKNLVHSPTISIASLLMLIADAVFAFMWFTYQGFRMNPIRRTVFPENLVKVVKSKSQYPSLDVFICTADPYKEPPMIVVNTALSVMAFDYPTEKLSVYVSDDGGSQLTLFAFMEAAKFAKHWLPYCNKNNIVDCNPEVYFASQPAWFPETDAIKLLYESMKIGVEKVVEKKSIPGDYISDDVALKTFSKWTNNFTRQDHPAVIQVLLESGIDKDATGHAMPNLVYVSREKNKATSHNFKAGALNVLLRVSASMTNAPIILTQDCDMYSNDPTTPLRTLCYFMDPCMDPNLAFIQFPQMFDEINVNDIYSGEFKYLTQINPLGFDGLLGPTYMGSGGFFRRKVFYGRPLPNVTFKTPELNLNKPLHSQDVLAQAHHVAGCKYEPQTKWGSEVGFRYGSLVEDLYTSYHLHCQGWKSVFCMPNRAAFLGNAPMNFNDLLNQTKRWSMGLLDVLFSKSNPLLFGIRYMNPFQTLCYTHYTFWPIWSIPVTIYSLIPQLTLINSFPVFPKVSDPWFWLHVYLFIGAYGQDFVGFILAGGTARRWWNQQRMWMIRGVTSFPFSITEYLLKSLGMSSFGFNVTTKVVDNEQSKRYDQGIFEFGVSSPMFVSLTVVAIINLVSFFNGLLQVLKNGFLEDMLLQMFLAGFVVINSWPIYEAMILRTDKGKMPCKITLTSITLAWVLYLTSRSFAY